MKTSTESLSQPIEDEAFWKQHCELQKQSSLSKMNYARQQHLNYDRFMYWIKKFNRGNDTKLISVKLKSPIERIDQPALCALILKNGNHLKIYHEKIVSIILARYY